VDPREFPAITRVFLAAGIGGLFGQHFPTGEDGGFYSFPGQASRTVSSAEEFRKFLMAHAILP
jgi:hypothetical protein